MRETRILKLSILWQGGSLIYDFCQEKNKIRYRSNELSQVKVTNPYPLPFKERYYSKQIISKNGTPHYDATKKTILKKLLHNSGLTFTILFIC